MDLEGVAYFVGIRPQVTWGWDLADRNLRFLRGIDPGYFEHIALSEGDLLDTDRKQYAAAAIRVAYSQGLETLLAVIAASLQSPTCVVGWMLAYKPDELRQLIKALRGGVSIKSHSSMPHASITSLATAVSSTAPWDLEKQERMARHLSRLWTRCATEFLDERANYEYNSFKHGMRAGLGGFTLAIGVEESLGVPAAPEAMRSLGRSEFGSTFYTPENISGRLHQYPRQTSRNWSPIAMAQGLQLIAMSIENVVSYLRIIGGDEPMNCKFSAPTDDASFELPWQTSVEISFTNMDLVVREDQIKPLTKAEVVALLTSEQPNV